MVQVLELVDVTTLLTTHFLEKGATATATDSPYASVTRGEYKVLYDRTFESEKYNAISSANNIHAQFRVKRSAYQKICKFSGDSNTVMAGAIVIFGVSPNGQAAAEPELTAECRVNFQET